MKLNTTIISGLLLTAIQASATFSLVAVDKNTKQVGGAFASCTAFLGDDKIQEKIYASVPGVGAIHGQSFYFSNKKDVMAYEMALNPVLYTPRKIISNLKDVNSTSSINPGDPLFENYAGAQGNTMLQRRQYLLVSLFSPGATFTGNSDEAVVGTPKERLAKSTESLDGRFAASLGGNTLTSKEVVKRMKSSFIANSDIVSTLKNQFNIIVPTEQQNLFRKGTLDEKLFSSIVAGGKGIGQGDNRCTPNGISSNQVYLRVDGANGKPLINLKHRCNTTTCKDGLTVLAFKYYVCKTSGTGCVDQ